MLKVIKSQIGSNKDAYSRKAKFLLLTTQICSSGAELFQAGRLSLGICLLGLCTVRFALCRTSKSLRKLWKKASGRPLLTGLLGPGLVFFWLKSARPP